MIEILRNEKLDIALADNQVGLPYVALVFRDITSGKTNGRHALDRESLDEVIRQLQRLRSVL